MRIEQLEYVVAVARHGSLRRASEKLHLSQPALSEAVSKLERELGVQLLDRRRTGSQISREGRDLHEHLLEVLDAVDRLRTAAGDESTTSRLVRLGTVNAATSIVVAPTVRGFQETHPRTTVEVVTMQQNDIHDGLLTGSLDLGLVNELAGDDAPVELDGRDILRGRPVVVLPAGHPLTAHDQITVEQLRAERFVGMRPGYVMHRFVNRLLSGDLPSTCHTADGAEMGKALVADGLGLTVLPDYSVLGDPLHRAGLITTRPIADDDTTLTLVLRHRRLDRLSGPARALVEDLTATAAAWNPDAPGPVAAPCTFANTDTGTSAPPDSWPLSS